MHLLRKQFNKLVIEQKFCSETQALLAAHKSWRNGSWHSVKVVNLELNIVTIEFGTEPTDAFRSMYAEAI